MRKVKTKCAVLGITFLVSTGIFSHTKLLKLHDDKKVKMNKKKNF